MAKERSLLSYSHWRAASDKLDYFVLGISVALTAYLGQRLDVARIAVDPTTLQLVSLLLFAASALAGLDRLKATVTAIGLEGQHLAAFERAGKIKTALTTGSGSHLIDSVSGETMTAIEAYAEIERQERRSSHAKTQRYKWNRRSETAYKWRDRLLMIGILAYAGAKLWAAARAS